MRFNCQFAVRYLLPAFRSIIAKQLLTKHGLKQELVADKLGITQAAVSNYLNSKRAAKCRRMLRDDFIHVHSLACETAENIVREKANIDEMKKGLCKLCMKLKEEHETNYII